MAAAPPPQPPPVPGWKGMMSRPLFSAVTPGQLLGTCADWPMRVMAMVLAANMRLDGVPAEWPVHIYTSPGCVLTTIGYAMTQLSVSNVLFNKLMGLFLPKSQSLGPVWTKFKTESDRLHSQEVTGPVTEADILAWSAESVRIHRELLDTALPIIKSHFSDVILNLTISTLVTNALVWPLKKIMAWMSVQSEGEITAFSQTPWRVAQEIWNQNYYPRGRRGFTSPGAAGGSILAAVGGFYTGFGAFALQALAQLALNSLAAGCALYGMNYTHEQINLFMNYQQTKKKIYDKKVETPMQATFTLYRAALTTVRKAVPLACLIGIQAFMLGGRLIACPLSLISTLRLVADSPSINSGACITRLSQQTDFQIFSQLFLSPMRREILYRWVGWGWKWIMLSVPFSMLGWSTTIFAELQ